jgi:hypothetical protein
MGREARIILASALLGSLSTAVTPAAVRGSVDDDGKTGRH